VTQQQDAQGPFLKAISKTERRTKRKKEGKERSRVGSRVEAMLTKRSKLLINMVARLDSNQRPLPCQGVHFNFFKHLGEM
jgi:hypothetical protein